jgi:hypothetical protein
MVENILGLLKEHLNDDVLGKISGILGEKKSGVTAAVGGAMPSLLLGLIKKEAEPGGADLLMRLLQEGKQNEGILSDPGGARGGGSATTDLLSSGKVLLRWTLGDKGRPGGRPCDYAFYCFCKI